MKSNYLQQLKSVILHLTTPSLWALPCNFFTMARLFQKEGVVTNALISCTVAGWQPYLSHMPLGSVPDLKHGYETLMTSVIIIVIGAKIVIGCKSAVKDDKPIVCRRSYIYKVLISKENDGKKSYIN